MVKSIFLKLLKCPPLTSLQNETFVCKKSVCKRLCVKSLLCVKRLCVKAFLCQHICVSIMFYGSAQRLCVKSPRCVYIYTYLCSAGQKKLGSNLPSYGHSVRFMSFHWRHLRNRLWGHNFNALLLLQFKHFPLGQWFPIVATFLKLSPGRGPCAIWWNKMQYGK